MRPIVNIYRLGRATYARTLDIQNVLFDNLKRIVTSPVGGYNAGVNDNARKEDGTVDRIELVLETVPGLKTACSHPTQSTKPLNVTNSLLLVEHEPVYTVGLRTQSYGQDYVAQLRSRLAAHKLEAEFVQTNRGGLITFHGPGQLVAYPIIHLGDFPRTIPNRSVKAYVKKLEDTIIETLARVGLEGAHTVREYPGVWLGGGARKVAFVGITCKRYVTMHGISINCDCDLSWFDHIISCGIEDKQITSVRNELLSRKPFAVASDSSRGKNESGSMKQDHQSVAYEDNPSHITTDEQQASCRISKSSGPEYSVENIANAFCSSFSHHFDCELYEG